VVRYPFKFNYVWLDEPYFVTYVKSNWEGLLGTTILNPMESMVQKLKILKAWLIKWGRKKKKRAREELVKLEM